MGLFHRGKIVPGTFMYVRNACTVPSQRRDLVRARRWRFRVPNGVLTSTQWRALGDVAAKYDNGSRDHWEPTGCADVTTRMNIQVRARSLRQRRPPC